MTMTEEKNVTRALPTQCKKALSYIDDETLCIAKMSLREQVDQKKLELQNRGEVLPSDDKIFYSLNTAESYRLMSKAIKEATGKKPRP